MYKKILNLIILEDTFQLFTHPGSKLDQLKSKINNFRSLIEFKSTLEELFQSIIINSTDETLEYYEAFKMLNYIEKVFQEIGNYSDDNFDLTEDIINIYLDTLGTFVKDCDNEILKDHYECLIMKEELL